VDQEGESRHPLLAINEFVDIACPRLGRWLADAEDPTEEVAGALVPDQGCNVPHEVFQLVLLPGVTSLIQRDPERDPVAK
jgi:hypothetical protein